jgi:hypothetical protein
MILMPTQEDGAPQRKNFQCLNQLAIRINQPVLGVNSSQSAGKTRQKAYSKGHGATAELHQSNAISHVHGELNVHEGLHEFSVNSLFTCP